MHVVLPAQWAEYMKVDYIFKCYFYFITLTYYKLQF